MAKNRTLLSTRDPLTTELREDQIDDLGIFVSEPRHLVTLADKVSRGQAVSCYELELHANLAMYWAEDDEVVRMAAAPSLGGLKNRWLRFQLFRAPSEPGPAVSRGDLQTSRDLPRGCVYSRFEGRA